MSYPIGQLDLVKVQDALYDWVKNEMNGVVEPEHIIWRNQSEPLPGRPCVTLRIMDGPRPVGRDPSVTANQDGTFNVGVQQEMTLSVQIFGNSQVRRPMAYQTAVDLNSSLMKSTVRSALSSAGIGVQQVGEPVNLTELEESQFEERAGFQVQLGLAQNLRDDPGTIQTVNVTKTIHGP